MGANKNNFCWQETRNFYSNVRFKNKTFCLFFLKNIPALLYYKILATTRLGPFFGITRKFIKLCAVMYATQIIFLKAAEKYLKYWKSAKKKKKNALK